LDPVEGATGGINVHMAYTEEQLVTTLGIPASTFEKYLKPHLPCWEVRKGLRIYLGADVASVIQERRQATG